MKTCRFMRNDYKRIGVCKDRRTVVLKEYDGKEQVLNWREFRMFIEGLNGYFGFTGAPRKDRTPLNFYFSASHGTVCIDKKFSPTVPSSNITDVEELAEILFEASIPERPPYGQPYDNNGFPNYYGVLNYMESGF